MQRHAWPMLLLALACAAVLWPAVVHLRSRWLAGHGDSSVFVWSWWAVPRELAAGRGPFLTDDIFHPVGADLSLTTTAPLIAVLTWPIRAALGPVAQVNIVQLAAAWCAAAGGYVLVHRLCRDRAVAVLAGLAFAFAPFRFVHLAEHLNLIHTGVLPLSVWLLFRFVDRPRLGRAAVLGAAVGLGFLVEPQLAILAVACLVPVGLVERDRLAGAWRELAVACVVAIVVAAPLLVPMAAAMLAGESSTVDPEQMVAYSTEPLRWLLPPSDHRLLGPVARAVLGRPPDEGLAYAGIAVLGLAVSSHWLVDRRRRRPWVWMALVGVVLAAGPYLAFRGQYVEVPLPFLGLRLVPGLSAFRVPGRFTIVAVLALVVLAALALTELLRRHARWRSFALAALVVVMAIDLLPRELPSRPGGTPQPYAAIASDDGDGAVLELPLQWSTGEIVIGDRDRDHTIFMEHAMTHEQPLVGGSVSRYPDERLDRLLDIDLYRQVLALQGDPEGRGRAHFDAEDLRDAGVGYVVYHRDRAVPAAHEYLVDLGLPVLADDGTVIVWQVPPYPPDHGAAAARRDDP